jgi:cytochrome c-type biogenesis protein CcmF
VHIGVVLIAVAFAASHSYGHSREFRLAPGQTARLAGHNLTYLGSSTVRQANKTSVRARVRIDGGKVYAPSVHQFPFATQAIGSPSVKSGLRDDVYLTLAAAPDRPGGTAVIGVFVQPLIYWLWIGGGVMALGTALAAWPGRRRRPTAPVSAPVETEPVPEPVAVP